MYEVHNTRFYHDPDLDRSDLFRFIRSLLRGRCSALLGFSKIPNPYEIPKVENLFGSFLFLPFVFSFLSLTSNGLQTLELRRVFVSGMGVSLSLPELVST